MNAIDQKACAVVNGLAALDPEAAALTTAQVFDEELETMATIANDIANQTRDERWTNAALALLGTRRLMRELMADQDREGTQ